MSTFLKVFKVEAKLGMRCIDSVFFGVIMPAGVFLLIAALCEVSLHTMEAATRCWMLPSVR